MSNPDLKTNAIDTLNTLYVLFYTSQATSTYSFLKKKLITVVQKGQVNTLPTLKH